MRDRARRASLRRGRSASVAPLQRFGSRSSMALKKGARGFSFSPVRCGVASACAPEFAHDTLQGTPFSCNPRHENTPKTLSFQALERRSRGTAVVKKNVPDGAAVAALKSSKRAEVLEDVEESFREFCAGGQGARGCAVRACVGGGRTGAESLGGGAFGRQAGQHQGRRVDA